MESLVFVSVNSIDEHSDVEVFLFTNWLFIKVGVWSERTFAMILWAIGAGIYVQVPNINLTSPGSANGIAFFY